MAKGQSEMDRGYQSRHSLNPDNVDKIRCAFIVDIKYVDHDDFFAVRH